MLIFFPPLRCAENSINLSCGWEGFGFNTTHVQLWGFVFQSTTSSTLISCSSHGMPSTADVLYGKDIFRFEGFLSRS